MGRRLISTAVGAWLLWGGAAFAQQTLPAGEWTELQAINASGKQVVQPYADKIAWSQQSDALDIGYNVTSSRNGGGERTDPLVATACKPGKTPGFPWDCVGMLPTAVVGAIAAGDRVDLKVGANPFEFTALQTIPAATATCRYVAPDGTVGTRPLDTSIGGTFSGVTGSGGKQAVAERIGMMRRDGWRVEWQWDPEETNFVVLMWCVGAPQ